MGEFRKRLVERMTELELRQADLVAMTGISRAMISSYVVGRYEPKDENLQALAKALRCEPLWLAGYDGVDEDDEMKYLEIFRTLNVEDKHTIITILKFMQDKQRRNDEGK